LAKDSLQQFRAFVKNREASFLMSPVKVTARTDIPEANLSTFTLREVSEGDVVEVPRWVAEVLEENNLVNMGEEGVEAELFRALQREKLQGPTQPSQLSKDIYLKFPWSPRPQKEAVASVGASPVFDPKPLEASVKYRGKSGGEGYVPI
jgi:hypothetical protein